MSNRYEICFEILKNIGNDDAELNYDKQIQQAEFEIKKMFENSKDNKEEKEELQSIFYILTNLGNESNKNDKNNSKYYDDKYIEYFNKNPKEALKKYNEYCKKINEINKINIQNMLNKLSECASFISVNKEGIPKYVSVYQYYKNLCLIAENQSYSYDKKDKYKLYGIDLSGIQSFIYTIHTTGALRMLRARSFYLEILMENIVDQILDEIEFTRINLMYSGAGHAYLLLPNDNDIKEKIDKYQKKLRDWCIEKFGTDICILIKSIDLKSPKYDIFAESFKKLGKEMHESKRMKYNIDDIKKFNTKIYNLNNNQKNQEKKTRECAVCLIDTNAKIENEEEILRCEICSGFNKLSNKLIEGNGKDVILPLPNNENMIFGSINGIINVKKDNKIIRNYCINNSDNEQSDIYNIEIYLGNYVKNKEFSEFIKRYEDDLQGINRIGILRADVDNLGKAFVYGFNEKYKNLITGAELSSQLALFFKAYIKNILESVKFKIFGNECENDRNVSIVYAGGDDVFIVGEFLDIIEFAIDLSNEFVKFTNGKLTLSAGIGLFNSKYPLAYMAEETGKLEDISKEYKDTNNNIVKNAVTLFSKGNTYSWDCFEEKVIKEKYKEIYDFFGDEENDKGSTFLYNLLQYLEKIKENNSIYIVRLVYLLSKLEQQNNNGEYRKFSEKIYQWAKNEEDRKQLITAIRIYIYKNRKTKIKEA